MSLNHSYNRGEMKLLPSHLPNAKAKSMEKFTLCSVMLNVTVDANDILCEVVKSNYCAMHLVVCKFLVH
jgi:hypothetical protein